MCLRHRADSKLPDYGRCTVHRAALMKRWVSFLSDWSLSSSLVTSPRWFWFGETKKVACFEDPEDLLKRMVALSWEQWSGIDTLHGLTGSNPVILSKFEGAFNRKKLIQTGR